MSMNVDKLQGPERSFLKPKDLFLFCENGVVCLLP